MYYYFLDKLKIPNGKKIKLIVPDYIKKGTKNIKCAFIRGLFDTDGCFNIKRNGKYNYPQITITSINLKMLKEIKDIINEFSILSNVYKYENVDKRTLKKHKRWVLIINGFNEVNKWINLIGTSSNIRHKQINEYYSNSFK